MSLESGVSLEEKFADLKIETSVLDFPDDFIENIFSKLDFVDQCRMRVNKRLCGIEDGMKKPLEFLSNLDICGHKSSSDLRIWIRRHRHYEIISISQAIKLVHRFVKVFKFGTIEFTPYQEEQMALLNSFSGVTTNFFNMPQLVRDPNLFSSHFDRSTICNLMQNSDVVKILRVCALTAEDLNHFYQIAKNNVKFCGLALRVTNNCARQFVKNFMGEGDKLTARTWKVMKIDGDYVMQVERSPSSGLRYNQKFSLHNTTSEAQYPHIRSNLHGIDYDSDSDVDVYEDCGWMYCEVKYYGDYGD